MSDFWVENNIPADYSRNLLMAPRPAFIVKNLVEPQVIWDFNAMGGDVVQIDRFKYLHDDEPTLASYTKEARTRQSTQTLGIGGGRKINKEIKYFTLRELTGPADGQNPNDPGCISVTIRDLRQAKVTMFDLNNITGFNDSIGASRLAVDFMMLEDKIYIYELLSTSQTYNPNDFADGGTVDLALNGFGGLPPKITVNHLRDIFAKLRDPSNNAMPFADNNFRCLATTPGMNHLKRDPEFLQIARYPGNLPVSMALTPSALGMEAPVPPQLSSQGMAMGSSGSIYQAGGYGGQTFSEEIMPTGFVFEGFRFFVSENIPRTEVTLTYSNATDTGLNGSRARTAEQLIFFGREALGLVVGGMGPEIKPHDSTDYNRHLHLIWTHHMELELLNSKFVVVARSYVN